MLEIERPDLVMEDVTHKCTFLFESYCDINPVPSTDELNSKLKSFSNSDYVEFTATTTAAKAAFAIVVYFEEDLLQNLLCSSIGVAGYSSDNINAHFIACYNAPLAIGESVVSGIWGAPFIGSRTAPRLWSSLLSKSSYMPPIVRVFLVPTIARIQSPEQYPFKWRFYHEGAGTVVWRIGSVRFYRVCIRNWRPLW